MISWWWFLVGLVLVGVGVALSLVIGLWALVLTIPGGSLSGTVLGHNLAEAILRRRYR